MVKTMQVFRFSSGLVLLAMTLPVHIMRAEVITFSGLSGGDNTPFPAYTEGNFTVTPLTNNWYQDDTAYGNPAPSIYDGPIGNVAVATVQITGHGDFTWQSFDYSSNNSAAYYDIRGFLGGVQQFNETGGLAGVFSPFHFITLTGTEGSTGIDTLDITFIPPVGYAPPTSINLDNIRVSSVPEPGSISLLGIGFTALIAGLSRRSRRRPVGRKH
jgi:hypothetical protein